MSKKKPHPTTSGGLPLPNSLYSDPVISMGVVIASCYLTDEDFLLLVLRKEPPHYVVISTYEDGTIVRDSFANIVPAVAAYVEGGGDYQMGRYLVDLRTDMMVQKKKFRGPAIVDLRDGQFFEGSRCAEWVRIG